MATKFLQRIQRLYHGWWVVLSGATVLMLSSGSHSGGSMGLFFVSLIREFGWSRTLISGAFTVVRIEGTILGPFEGYMTDRLGPHRMIALGFVILAMGFFVLSVVSHPVHFYIAMVVMATGASIGSYIPVMVAVNWWFNKKRNTAMGLAQAGFGMGILLSPIIAWGITQFDWRTTAIGLGVVLLITGIPLSRMFRSRPTQENPAEEAVSEEKSTQVSTQIDAGEEFTIREAIRTRAFWIIPMVHGASQFTTMAVYVHGVPHLTDVGLHLQAASYAMAAYGVIEILTRVLLGSIGDRVDKRHAIFFYCTVQSLGVVALAYARNIPTSFLFSLLFGIGHGGRGPLLAAIRGEYFGRKSFGTILGIGSLVPSLAGMPTPLALGILYATQGTYLPGFLIMSALTFLGGFLILGAARPTLIKKNPQD